MVNGPEDQSPLSAGTPDKANVFELRSEGVPFISDLPEDLDPNSPEQLAALSDDQLTGGLEDGHRLHAEAVGFSTDIVSVGLSPEGFYADADPREVAVYMELMREFIRRTVQNPHWNLTKDYLFPEEKTDGK